MQFQNEEKLLNQLKKQIDNRPFGKNIAALDADGTLWAEDANNILLEYQIKHGIKNLDNLLNSIYKKEEFRYKRCELFAESQAGLSLKEFKSLCLQSLQQKPLHVFSFQKKLCKYLKKQGLKIVVVTASVKWLVETAVNLYELPIDVVLGTHTRLNGSYITKTLIRPAPVASFKGKVFLQHSKGEKCFLAGGNTIHDMPLLEMATLPFVVHSATKEKENFSTEIKLKKIALKKKWSIFQLSK